MRKTIFSCICCIATLNTSTLMAQWTQTNGLPGGSTSQLVNYGDTVLASIGAGLYYSVNHGKAWSPIVHPDYNNIRVVSVDAAQAFGYAYKTSQGTFTWFRTDDFFQTIHPVVSGPNGTGLYKPLLANGFIYSGAFPGLYRSNNDGLSWEQVSAISPYEMLFDGARLTVYSYPYVLQSTDGGFAWDTLLQVTGNVYAMAQHENHLLLVNGSPAPTGCYVSSNYGQNWQYYANNALYGYYEFAWHQGAIFGLDGNRMIKSTDLGQSWTPVSFAPNLSYPANHGISSGNALIIGGSQTVGSPGLHRSVDNGTTWSPVTFGVVASSGKFRAVGHDLFVAGPGGLFKLGSGGQQWTNFPLQIPHPEHDPWYVTDIVFVNGAWVLSDYHNPWYTTDQGGSWKKSMFPVSPTWQKENITYFETVRDKVFGWGFDSHFNQFYTSVDKGVSFQNLWVVYDNQQFRAKAMDIDQEKVFVFGQNNDIYRSDDGGLNWAIQSNVNPIDTIAAWNAYEVSLHVSGQAMALCSNGPIKVMLLSFDGGETWSYHASPTSSQQLWGNSLFNDLTQVGNKVVAATPNGIYFTENSGIGWEAWNTGLPYSNVAYLKPFGGYLWASVGGGGIWKRPLNQLGFSSPAEERSLGLEDAIPSAPLLLPNPARTFVRIDTGGEQGEFSLLDVAGRSVLRQLLSGMDPEVSLQGLPSGLYQALFRGEKSVRQASLVIE